MLLSVLEYFRVLQSALKRLEVLPKVLLSALKGSKILERAT